MAPIDGVQLPYWAGTWLGIYPTWQGVLGQIGAATFVVGSYLAAEHVRARRRRRVLSSLPSNSLTVESGRGAN